MTTDNINGGGIDEMTKKLWSVILFILAGAVLVSSCQKQMVNDSAPPAEMVSTPEPTEVPATPLPEPNVDIDLPQAENISPYNELIKTIYTEDELLESKKFNREYSKVEGLFEIECVRVIGDKFYTILKSNNGGTLYMLFGKNDKGKYVSEDVWYFTKKLYRQNFDALTVGSSTRLDVKMIDPFDDYFIASGLYDVNPFSTHYTVDGYIIKLEYERHYVEGTADEQLRICSMTSENASGNSIYSMLIPMDKPGNN